MIGSKFLQKPEQLNYIMFYYEADDEETEPNCHTVQILTLLQLTFLGILRPC